MFDLTDGIVLVLLVGFSAIVLVISLLAYADRKTSGYFFLSSAFGFLAASEVGTSPLPSGRVL
jgi:hypothetical protein